MADVFTKAKRSAVMSLIRSRGNRATELRLIALMREHGITGWRRNARVFGKPDFVFRRERVAVFVDGCFWHGCPRPKHAPLPKNRAEWWAAKLLRNKERDRTVTRALRAAGWKVVRVWECALSRQRGGRMVARIAKAVAAARGRGRSDPARSGSLAMTVEHAASGGLGSEAVGQVPGVFARWARSTHG
jgi:DNA mismatch endonuclease (patch repair protein)